MSEGFIIIDMDASEHILHEVCERERCRKPFTTRKPHQRFCSEKCRKLQEKLRARERKRMAGSIVV